MHEVYFKGITKYVSFIKDSGFIMLNIVFITIDINMKNQIS